MRDHLQVEGCELRRNHGPEQQLVTVDLILSFPEVANILWTSTLRKKMLIWLHPQVILWIKKSQRGKNMSCSAAALNLWCAHTFAYVVKQDTLGRRQRLLQLFI